jgi:flagellar hook assembly protein FlgD
LQRILSTGVLVGLLVATAAAFAITERLKLTKSPITGTKIVRGYVSPRAHTTAAVNVRFRRSDLTTVTIEDSHSTEVDTLAYRVSVPRGRRTFTWNGLMDDARPAPDGTYRMEIHLVNQHRTILLPNPIVLDTRPPAVLDAGAVRPVFSPDGDHQSDTVTIHYRLSEDAHVLVFLDGRRIIRGRSSQPKNKVSWNGNADGRLLPQGKYTLVVSALDLAGNRAAEVQQVSVDLRYIALGTPRVRVNGAAVLRIAVSTDAKRYRWSLAGRSGTSSAGALRVRVPRSAGRYTLTVTEHGHSARAVVVVG